MTAGLDSRGGMELRRTLAEALGMELPVTLLYDYQTIDDIVEYINSTVSSSKRDAGEEELNDMQQIDSFETKPQVSKLMKTLRPPATERPLFLAAPGVANAQSAYFSFSMFLQV